MSKLLADLEAAIGRAADDASRGELLARKACYMSRIGSFPEATVLIADLRAQFQDGRSPRVSIWIMLAEGLLHTFRDMSDEGADRIMRANALANATRDRPLIAVTSAWRAYTQSERSEFKGMARSLDNAFANSDSSSHDVLARLYMILGNARMSIGDRTTAYELYMFSRHHALECGDQATIDALLYNKPAFALAWDRARMCFGEANVEHLRTLRLELTSAKAYQQMVGVSALANFVHLWMARLLLICSEFEAAVPALRAVRSMQPFARYNYNVSLIDLEIGFCLLRLGKLEAALAEVQSALQVDLGKLHDDDRLVAAWIRNELLEALPQMGDSAKARVELESERNAFEAGCTGLREVLDGLAPQPHILRPTIVLPRAAS